MIEVDEYTHEPFPCACDMCGGPGPCLYALRGGRSFSSSLFTPRGRRAIHRERTLRVCSDACREAAEVALTIEFSDRPDYVEPVEDETPTIVTARRPAQRRPP